MAIKRKREAAPVVATEVVIARLRDELKAAQEDEAEWRARSAGYREELNRVQANRASAAIKQAELEQERDAAQARLDAVEYALALVLAQLRAAQVKSRATEAKSAIAPELRVDFVTGKVRTEWALAT